MFSNINVLKFSELDYLKAYMFMEKTFLISDFISVTNNDEHLIIMLLRYEYYDNTVLISSNVSHIKYLMQCLSL